MAEPPTRSFLAAVEAALAQEDESYAHYRRARRRVKRDGRVGTGPQAFDESGFPLPAERPGLRNRVSRLLNA